MLFLIVDVGGDGIQIGNANRKTAVATLPGKFGNRWLGFQPEVRCAFQFLDPIRLRDRSAQTGKDVDVIFDSTHTQRRAFESFGNFPEVSVQREAQVAIR